MSLTSSGCEGSCRKPRIKVCKCRISGWYYSPPRPWMRIDGETPQVHEEHHADLIEDVWSHIRAQITIFESFPCMCYPKAACIRDAFNGPCLKAMIHRCAASNHQFDCAAYPDSPQKTQACADRDTAKSQDTSFTVACVIKMMECASK